jgi:hypothetical protein
MKKALMLMAILFAFPAFAQGEELPPRSLFLTPQEVHEARARAQMALPAGKGDIHLGAVLYFGPHDWTVWLQGEKWTPETVREDLEILEVMPTEVRVSWRNPEAPEPLELALKPNQSYRIATGKIVTEP